MSKPITIIPFFLPVLDLCNWFYDVVLTCETEGWVNWRFLRNGFPLIKIRQTHRKRLSLLLLDLGVPEYRVQLHSGHPATMKGANLGRAEQKDRSSKILTSFTISYPTSS